MSLLTLLSKSIFGFGGNKPSFDILPKPPSSFHDTYSIDGSPKVTVKSTNPVFKVPQPSILDEIDTNNTNKYRSKGKRYYQ
jgi:hypothetical protein